MKILRVLPLVLTTSAFASPRETLDWLRRSLTEPRPHATQSTSSPVSCRDEIRGKMCLVDPDPEGVDCAGPRECRAGGEAYAAHFETLYDLYPERFRREMCELTRIYVESDFQGTAYGGGECWDESRKVIGIRKSAIDEKLDLATWATWKEQLSFGGDPSRYDAPKPELPRIRVEWENPPPNDFLYFVIAHELGHVVDFADRVNDFDCDTTKPSGPCPAKAGSYSLLSWDVIPDLEAQPMLGVRADVDFLFRRALCFYWCKDRPDRVTEPSVIRELYRGLEFSNFVSTYGATNPWDDFAEAAAYWLGVRDRGLRYRIDFVHAEPVYVHEHLRSERLAPKMRDVEKRLAL